MARTAAPPARLLPKKNIVPFQVNCFTVFRGYVFYCVVCGKSLVALCAGKNKCRGFRYTTDTLLVLGLNGLLMGRGVKVSC